ncbi:putative neural cell expressed, developmentally down-regulated 1 [Operophtera brumata]|uniref:Putative neural cell expressed, developmentally down-regulated 1 n=1 Tax=Operophtera brumata TaxID=104452 RepID=A0A0L7LID0_OPEBR|nr:putative neural cell expressed, developmentally down-regulated 1 [Operophtera brumata]
MYISSVSSRLLLYDTNSWDLKKSYGCYDGILRDISWSDDSKYILQVNSKGIIEILSAVDHDVRSLQHIPVKDSWSASFHRDGHRNVAIGTRNGNVMIWDTKNKSITKTFPSPSQQCSVNYISYNAKNTSLAATMQNGETVIYSLVSNIPVLTVKLAHSRSISSMKFHHESRSLLGLATDEGHVLIRDILTNKDKVFFENVHASPVSDIAFSLVNRDVMLSCGYDKAMHVYDVRLQNVVTTLKTPYTLTSLAINLDYHVALGTKNGLLLVYDLRDLSNPFKVLKGHDEEVHRVAFQPIRKKGSGDISLKEDTESLSPMKLTSPVRTRTSDMFFITESPAKCNFEVSPPETDNKADSFLVMMGLDKSNNDLDDDDGNKTSEYDRKSDRHEARYRQLDAEKNISKMSTPLNSRTAENLSFPSPLIINGIDTTPLAKKTVDDERCASVSKPCVSDIDTKTFEDLKDFIKLTLADVADDNRNYFLHIMMALTKQKLYLEKQLANMNRNVNELMDNQSALLERNRQLALEIDQLKTRPNLI